MGRRGRKSRHTFRPWIPAGLVLLIAFGVFPYLYRIVEADGIRKVPLEAEAEEPDVEKPAPVEASKGWTIVLDPGHQEVENPGLEPVGPGSHIMKKKVSSGTRGTRTGIYEHQYVLDVGLQVRELLEAQGFKVIMTRTGSDVDLSNVDRARIANEADADLFLRIHANGSSNPDVHGISTYTMPGDSPFNGHLAEESERVAAMLLTEIVRATGAKDRGNHKSVSYTGINWSEVPVVILETGFMTNPEEERLLSMESYQEKMARGIVEAIKRYFEEGPF